MGSVNSWMIPDLDQWWRELLDLRDLIDTYTHDQNDPTGWLEWLTDLGGEG